MNVYSVTIKRIQLHSSVTDRSLYGVNLEVLHQSLFVGGLNGLEG